MRLQTVLTACVFAAGSASAQEPPPPQVPAPEPVRVGLVGHEGLVDLLDDTDGSVVTLGSDGLVIRWEGSRPVAWARFEDADDLALAGDSLVVSSSSALHFVDRGLAPVETRVVDGRTPCGGADSVWAWALDPPEAFFLSPAGRLRVHTDQTPLGDALCTVAGDQASLTWHDGFGAIALTSTGETLSAEWERDTSPRAVPSGSGWEIPSARPESAFIGVCDLAGPAGVLPCAAPSASRAERFLRPPVRAPIGAALLADAVAIADRSGWTLVVVREEEPIVIRFEGPVVGVATARRALAFTCDPLAPTPTLLARVIATGATTAEWPVDTCPTSMRMVSGRPVFDAGLTTVAWEPDAGVFVGGSSAAASGALMVSHAWSGPCAGVAASVVSREDHRRVSGPYCGNAWLLDTFDAAGRRLGVAVCTEADAPPVAVLRTDGALVEHAFVGDCSGEAIRAPGGTHAPSEFLESDTLRTVVRAGGGVAVVGANERVEILVVGDDVIITSEQGFWSSPGLWDRLVWSTSDDAHSLSDPTTATRWDPSAVRRLFAP